MKNSPKDPSEDPSEDSSKDPSKDTSQDLPQDLPSNLPEEFWQGVNQFNHQEFYACHDTLESLWMEALEPDRRFYQRILQIAVGLYHLSHHNWRGAVTLLGEGIGRLQSYQPEYGTVDLDTFLRQSQSLLQGLQTRGPESIEALRQGWVTIEALPQITRVVK